MNLNPLNRRPAKLKELAMLRTELVEKAVGVDESLKDVKVGRFSYQDLLDFENLKVEASKRAQYYRSSIRTSENQISQVEADLRATAPEALDGAIKRLQLFIEQVRSGFRPLKKVELSKVDIFKNPVIEEYDVFDKTLHEDVMSKASELVDELKGLQLSAKGSREADAGIKSVFSRLSELEQIVYTTAQVDTDEAGEPLEQRKPRRRTQAETGNVVTVDIS